MTKPRRDPVQDLWKVKAALAESIVDASDDELLAETRQLGEESLAEKTRALLLAAVERHAGNEQLAAARAEHARRAAELAGPPRVPLPATPAERRSLLERLFAAQPRLQLALTAQHREFTTLSDGEVESYLRQLAALGALDELADDER